MHPRVVTDTDLIACKAPKDINIVKHVELVASMFSVNNIGATLMVDNHLIAKEKKFVEDVNFFLNISI